MAGALWEAEVGVAEMSRVVDLWREGMAPGVSGLYRADGSARAVHVDSANLSFFRLGNPLDLDHLLSANPRELADIDESARMTLPDGSGYACCGEGAHGSEGFFARLDSQGNLVWIVFLRNGNPFMRIHVDETRVTFINNLSKSVTVDLASSDFALLPSRCPAPGLMETSKPGRNTSDARTEEVQR